MQVIRIGTHEVEWHPIRYKLSSPCLDDTLYGARLDCSRDRDDPRDSYGSVLRLPERALKGLQQPKQPDLMSDSNASATCLTRSVFKCLNGSSPTFGGGPITRSGPDQAFGSPPLLLST